MAPCRVLVVEDQAELADDIADGLRDQGIGADVGLRRLGTPSRRALLNPYDVVLGPRPAHASGGRGLRARWSARRRRPAS